MKKLILVFSLLLYLMEVQSDCCGSYTITFVPRVNPAGRCDRLVPRAFRHTDITPGEGSLLGFKWAKIRAGDCKVKVCANGRPARNVFCGKGQCNIFGCACIGGCITGNPNYPEDALRNFMDLFSNDIYLPTDPPPTTTTTTTEDPLKKFRKCG